MNLKSVLQVAVGALVLAAGANATPSTYYLVSTTINGAQTQIDTDHSSIWLFTPNVDFGLIGANVVMKDGPQTSVDALLTLWLGSPATGTSIAEVVLTNAPFTQSFDPVLFQFASIPTLTANQQYTLVLHSTAPDAQNQAYFIKGSNDVGFATTTNGTPDPVTGPITNVIGDPLTASLPEPGTYVLASSAFALFAGLRVIRRRKSKAA